MIVPLFGLNYNDLFVRQYSQQTVIMTKETYEHKTIRLIQEYTKGDAAHVIELWTHESGLRYNAVNSSSGACGIPQAMPCGKMPCGLTPKDIECQIKWGYKYITKRYGSGQEAYNFWLSQSPHWY